MGNIFEAIWDDIHHGEIRYSDLSESAKAKLADAIESGTPFMEYWVIKTLTEVNPEIVDGRYISPKDIVKYMIKLMVNSALPNSEQSVQVSDTTEAQ